MEDIKFGTISKEEIEKLKNDDENYVEVITDADYAQKFKKSGEFTNLEDSLEYLKTYKKELTDEQYSILETKLRNLAKENIFFTEHDIKNNVNAVIDDGVHGVETLSMFEKAGRHMTRMENDPEYCKQVEKKLYKGLPPEYYEKVEQEYEDLKKELKSKGIDIDEMVKQEVEEIKKKTQEESESQRVNNLWKM